MKLLDILNENTEYLVKYTVLKDKDFSKGTASYKDEADAKKFFTDLQKDDEVISATLRKKVGPDSSRDMMGGAAKHLGSEFDLDTYTHPAYYKKGELEGQEKNIRSFLNSPQFLSKKRGFTNKDGSDPYFQEGLEENTSLEELYNQVQESKYGFFGNSEGNTAAGIMTEALNEYEEAVEKAFQKLVNKTNTAINIEKSGGFDTEVRQNLAYQFDKIQEKITTGDYLNATFYK